jgi:hypothetical protein
MSSLKCWIWPFQQFWRLSWPKSTSVRQSAAYTTLLFSAVFPAGLGSLFAGPPIDRWDRLVTSTQSSRLVHQSPPVLRTSHGPLADRSWLEAIQQARFGFLHVSFHGLLGRSSVFMLQNLDNLHMLSGFHKTIIESQHSSHVFHHTSLQERILVPFGSYIGRNDAFAG